MHMSEVRCLDGVVGIEGVRDPMFTIIISTSCLSYGPPWAHYLGGYQD
jgi:hypothetical protein